MNSKRSIHFPLSMGAGDRNLTDEPPKPERAQPSILTVGAIGRDHLVFGEQLRTLHYEPADYHGKLQVMLSALRRMEANLKLLIEEVESR